jgi:hypothetical protein
MTTIRIAAVFAAACTLLASSARAQTAPVTAATDSRWTAWLGCWRAADDPGGTGARVCVLPASGGVTLRTIVGGQMVSDELRVADGAPRPVRESGCSGTETARWSADGRRVYRATQASCGAETPRTLAAASFFVPGSTWVDVQTVTHEGATNVRVDRYVRAANQRLGDGTTAPQPPAGVASALVSPGWTTDEVVEVSAVLPPEGVQAAIGEGPTAFRLNAKSLTSLADGGVADRVIDLMVALTYPEKFVVERPGGGGGGLAQMGMMAGMAADPFFAQVVGPAALYDCYGAYGWATSRYWSQCAGFNQFGLGMFPGYYNGYYNGYLGYGGYGAWIPVSAQGAGSIGDPQDGGGRVVNGRGYVQVRPVETSSGGLHTADRSSGGGQGSSSGSSGGSSSGATSSGYSGGSSMGGGGGMAVPRPPGAY